MQIKEEQTITKTRVVVVKTLCDLCKQEVREPAFTVNEIEISHKTGSAYPECGSGELVAFDLCGDCFDKRLRPWLESQGAVPRVEEWDY